MSNTLRQAGSGLRSACLPFPEVLAQSIANVAPTATPVMNLPLVFASAGNSSWLAYVIATIGLVLVSLNINQFARRCASPGSIYTYTALGLGRTVGVLTGWALAIAYLFTAMATLCGFTNYWDALLGSSGLHVSLAFAGAICAGVAWFFAYGDVRMSAGLMLVLEVISVGLILILAGVVFFKSGFKVDTSQLSLQGVSPEGLRLGLVLAIFSYVGFESATTLGDEAKNPLHSIPRAVIWSTVMAGIFFILMAYVEVMAFSGSPTPFNEITAPLSVLATQSGIGFLGPLISLGAMVSFFACSLASINAGSRILFVMGRHGILPALSGQVHPYNETPYIAVTVSALIVFLVPTVMSAFGLAVLDIYGYLGTIATFGFLLVYILVSAAAAVYLYQEGQLRQRDLLLSGFAILFMLVPTISSVYPAPAAPYNLLPYLFLALMAIGGAWFGLLRVSAPQAIEQMARELELIHQKAR